MKQFLCGTALGLLATFMVGCGVEEDTPLEISSLSFSANTPLPAAYTCEGKAFSASKVPELHWTAGPKSTLSYAIVVKDLSLVAVAPEVAYHWMIWNIPASVRSLPEGLSGEKNPPAMQGAEQFSAGPDGGYAYLGPCPSWATYCAAATPKVTDNYSFTIYAFDVSTLAIPAKDTSVTKNYVGQIDHFFIENAIATAEIRATSNATPTSIPFPCPVAAKIKE